MTEQPIGIPEDFAKSQQLLGWVYACLQSGKAVDVAEWNRAITTLSAPTAA